MRVSEEGICFAFLAGGLMVQNAARLHSSFLGIPRPRKVAKNAVDFASHKRYLAAHTFASFGCFVGVVHS